MSYVGRFLVVLTLFAVQSLAKPNIDQVFDRFADNGRPSSLSQGQSECIKDLLLVVDISYSIGRSAYLRDVKPFLKRLINDPTLNVGPDGTHIALIIFSSMSRTKLLFNFGDKPEKQEVLDYIEDNMGWDSVSGDRTRTDVALKIANAQVFPKPSPENNRLDIDDVVILLTDGKPQGIQDALKNTINNAKTLKDKDILIVAAAIGPKRKHFLPDLQKIATSAKYTVEANFNEMDSILGRLVASSCTKPGQCICDSTESSPINVKPGHSKAEVRWPAPRYECWSGRAAEQESVSVDPPLNSPHRFSVGKHTITYTFKLKGGVDVVCPVNLEVKGELCRGIAFNSINQVCCCGTIYTKKSDHKCCGPDYYSISGKQCCSNSNLVSVEESCPSA